MSKSRAQVHNFYTKRDKRFFPFFSGKKAKAWDQVHGQVHTSEE
jgi:hypothetical protein